MYLSKFRRNERKHMYIYIYMMNRSLYYVRQSNWPNRVFE